MSAIEELVRRMVALERRTGRLEAVESVPAGGQGKRLLGVFSVPLTDNAATNVFHIVTTNEAGNNDAGGYVAHINAMIIDGNVPAAGAVAVKGWQGMLCRAMESTGTGVSALTELYETASAATSSANRDIGAVTFGAAEISEYDVYVQATVDHTGALGSLLTAVLSVELIWYGFATPPVLAAA